ncbi:MAG: hypothetical protein OXH68_15255 [Gammaproteobacteria bacterium]|nr:hypothetical protein [Gammaproteobacteria bacterium]
MNDSQDANNTYRDPTSAPPPTDDASGSDAQDQAPPPDPGPSNDSPDQVDSGEPVETASPAELLAQAVSELTRCANDKSAAVTADSHARDAIADADAQMAVAVQGKQLAVERKQQTAVGIQQANEAGQMAGQKVNDAVSAFVSANFSG